MARVSRFTEEFDLDCTSFPILERSITSADEKTGLITSTESVAKPKTINIFARAIKAARRLGTNCVTDCGANYRHHFCNLGQNVAHDDEKNIEGASMSSFSSYGASMASAEELEQQFQRNNLSAVYGLRLHDESSTLTAYIAKKQPTTAITKAQATAEPRTPDAPTVWAQAFDVAEIERIEYNTMVTIEYLAHLGL